MSAVDHLAEVRAALEEVDRATTGPWRTAVAVASLRNAAVAIAALVEEADRLRATVAEAKRLGLEACALAVGAMDNAPGHTGDHGDESSMAAGHRHADDIRTALEDL